jgi:hypothetical protein
MPQEGVPGRWPLYAPLQTRTSNAPFVKDSRLYNAYAEMDRVTGEYQIYKRPGLGGGATSGPTGTGLGLYTETGSGSVYGVVNNQLCLYFGGATPDFVAELTVDNGGPYAFETVGPATFSGRYVILGNGNAAYYVLLDSGPPFHRATYGQITDPNFPGSFVYGWCVLDGYTYVMDFSGGIWGSNGPNNPLVWSSTNVIYASSSSDFGVALAKQLNYLVAFKQYTTQIFYDAGNPAPGSPLAPVPDAQIPMGCLAGTSVRSIDNSLLWISSNQTISPQVVQMDNLSWRVVSTPDVDRILDNISWTGNPGNGIRAWVLKHAGHRFYCLNLIFNNITLVYDLDQKGWYIWTDYQGNYWPVVETAFVGPGGGEEGIHLAQHYVSGRAYPLDGDYNFPDDYGNVFPVDIYTPNFDGKTSQRKFLNQMYFDCDAFSGNELSVRYSDDDYASWSNFRTADISKRKPRLNKNGTFHHRRAYHFRHQKALPLRIRAAYPRIELGTL